MCGRFVAASDPEGLVRFFVVDDRKDDDLPPNYNVAPTDPVGAVAEHGDSRYLVTFRWGLVPPWASSPKAAATMINARAESVLQKPAFRDAARRRRCLIPADGFYEWRVDGDGVKVPHFIRRSDRQPMAFAGLWESWRDQNTGTAPLRTCTIITRAAQGPVAALHDRMPLALDPHHWEAWLATDTPREEVLAILHADPPELTHHAVSPRVNTVANNDAGLLEPAGKPAP
ncbi:MAG: hypothetical protein GEU74_11695 [Nitriliruptorales bacterium]|nr:hypothetical protein [Nitriliruptorales bacterium]